MVKSKCVDLASRALMICLCLFFIPAPSAPRSCCFTQPWLLLVVLVFSPKWFLGNCYVQSTGDTKVNRAEKALFLQDCNSRGKTDHEQINIS